MNTFELATAISNTLIVACGSMAVAIPVGGLLAILLGRLDVWGRRWAWLALGSQLAIPLYVFAGGWSAALGSQGWAPLATVDWAYSRTGGLLAVTFIHAAAAVPWCSLIFGCGLLFADRSLEEVAWLEGGAWSWLRQAIIPKLAAWCFAAGLWTCLPVFTEMVVTNLYQVPTIAEQVYLDSSRGNISPLSYLAAFAISLLPIGLIGLGIRRRLPPMEELSRKLQFARSPQWRLGKWRAAASLLAWLLIALFVLVPLFNLLIKAGWTIEADAMGQLDHKWTAARLLLTVQESTWLFGAEFKWSMILAASSSATAFVTAIALRLIAQSRTSRRVVTTVMLLLVGLPGPLVGMLVIDLLNRDAPVLSALYDRTLTAPLLAQQARLLPLAWLAIAGLRASISRPSWEMAHMEGLSLWQKLRTVIWPEIGSRVILIGALLFVFSFGELSASILVLPPGVTTVPMRLFEMLHFGMRYQDSGLCLLLLLLGWLVAGAAWKTLSDR